jgi:hypothetical protein
MATLKDVTFPQDAEEPPGSPQGIADEERRTHTGW